MLNLKTNSLTKTFASGAVAIATLAGIGLATSPVQAGNLNLIQTPANTGLESVGGTTPPQYWQNLPNTPSGYDNPLVVLDSVAPGEVVTLDIAYVGDGSAALRNQFQWLNGPNWTGGTFTFDGNTPNVCSPGPGCWTGPYTPAFVASVDGLVTPKLVSYTNTTGGTQTNVPLPFRYVADVNGAGTIIPNGDTRASTDFPHYYAVLGNDPNPSNVIPSNLTGKILGLGLSDRPREVTDNDASDSNVRFRVVSQVIPTTPEPSSILGLLALGGLGLALKRKKQG